MQDSELITNISALPPQIREQIKLLEDRFKLMLSPEDTNTTSITLFAQMMLRKFPAISISMTAEDVCHQAYIRAFEKVKTGLLIRNHPAWFKTVIVNILREEQREQKRQIELQRRYLDSISEQNKREQIDYLHDTDKFNKITKCLQALDIKDKQLLKLKIVEGMSYQEIGEYYVQSHQERENNEQLQQRLRQRLNRAKRKLREDFFNQLEIILKF